MSPPSATPPTPMIAVKISVIVSILDRADNVHYVRNGGTWKLKRKTITFGSVGKNTVVGTVPNVGNISHAYGMVLLGSGSIIPLTFFHPDYPNRAASFSVNASGQIFILYGSENTLQRGRITICWEY